MARQTTAYYTLKVERYGTSGPDNIRRIERFIEALDKAQNPKDKYMDITVDAHHYSTFHESVE